MIPLKNNPNVDNSDLENFPGGRIKDNQGQGNGTPVNRNVYGDLHSNISKLMRLYGIIPNDFPDNESNGYQLIEAFVALASKNDFIYPLGSDGSILTVDIKLVFMKPNEFIICLAGLDKTVETQIKGIGSTLFAVTYVGSYKANEYVRVIKTNTGISIVRIADWASLESMVTDLLFLKKASQEEEDAGEIDIVATTPLTNFTAFMKRVNGPDSINYLATALRNGLYPKEHFVLVEGIGAPIERNYGTISGLNVGSPVGTVYQVGGDILTATKIASIGSGDVIECVFLNQMDNSIYEVDTSVQSLGDFDLDNNYFPLNFKPINTTKFQFYIEETNSSTQSLKIHFSIKQR